MKMFKRAIARMLSVVGYELNRTTGPRVGFANFVSLTQAYEQRLNESGHFIPANEVRPELLGRLQGTPPSEAYFIIEALAQCKDIDGDVCEFGVAQGETSALIANEIAGMEQKTLHLFDSFGGVPMPSEKDELKNDISGLGSIDAYTGAMVSPPCMVRTRLEAISFPPHRWVIHKGPIDGVVGEDRNLPGKVCFAYVDFDYYRPTKIALEFLHQITANGAIVIVDDYDYFSTGAKAAVDEFTRDKNLRETSYACFVPDKRYGHFAVLTRYKDVRDTQLERSMNSVGLTAVLTVVTSGMTAVAYMLHVRQAWQIALLVSFGALILGMGLGWVQLIGSGFLAGLGGREQSHRDSHFHGHVLSHDPSDRIAQPDPACLTSRTILFHGYSMGSGDGRDRQETEIVVQKTVRGLPCKGRCCAGKWLDELKIGPRTETY